MEEKTEKPTPKKLRDAKKRGEVAKSAHLTQALSLGLVLVALALAVPSAWRWCRAMFELVGLAAAARPVEERLWATVQWIVEGFLGATFFLLALAAFAAAAAVLIQVRGVFSVDPIKPKLDKLNVGQNLKNLFSTKQLFELFKSTIETLLLSAVFYLIIKSQLPNILKAQQTDLGTAALLGAKVLAGLFFAAFVVSLLTAVMDFGHQKYEFLKKQRMSRQELRHEHKDVEGDPMMRSLRKRTHRALTQAPLRQQVERASVVVTNPTHIAVGLRYEPGDTDVPIVVVKGADDLALQIRMLAESMQVPVVESRELARALFARTGEEECVAEEFFDAIAAILVAVRRRPARPA